MCKRLVFDILVLQRLRHVFLRLIKAGDQDKNLCECNTTVDKYACMKRDEQFNGSFSCYVKEPSLCNDLKEINGKQRSARACEDKNEGESTQTILKLRFAENLIET